MEIAWKLLLLASGAYAAPVAEEATSESLARAGHERVLAIGDRCVIGARVLAFVGEELPAPLGPQIDIPCSCCMVLYTDTV